MFNHNHWVVKLVTKVAGVFAVALVGMAGLNFGCTGLFVWLFGNPQTPPRPSTQVRLQRLDETLKFNKTLLADKERAFFIFHKNESDWPFGKWETAFQKMVHSKKGGVAS